MKCYSLVLSALLLAVPAHAVNNDNDNNNKQKLLNSAKNILYSAATINAMLSFACWTKGTVEELQKFSDKSRMVTGVLRLTADTVSIAAIIIACNDIRNLENKIHNLEKNKQNKDKAKSKTYVNPQKFGPIELRNKDDLK